VNYKLRTPRGIAFVPIPAGWVTDELLCAEHYPLPWWFRKAYYAYDRAASRYAIIGLHWLLRLWQHRWAPFRLLTRLGFWDVEPGGYYRSGHFTLRYWRTLDKRYRRYLDDQAERIRNAERLALEWEASFENVIFDLTHMKQWRERHAEAQA
jgi:hypothetical protein